MWVEPLVTIANKKVGNDVIKIYDFQYTKSDMNFNKNFIKTPILSILFIFPFLLPLSTESEWTLEKDTKGIKIYTRAKKDSPLKEFKAITQVNTSLSEMVAYMKQVDNYINWFDAVTEVKLLEQVGADEFYVYINNSAPWPVKDRDNITRMQFVQDDSETVTIHVTGLPDYIPHHDKRVRIPYIEGFWQFKKIDATTTEVTQQMHAAPGGAIPNWLANMVVVDNPFNTLKTLKKHFE